MTLQEYDGDVIYYWRNLLTGRTGKTTRPARVLRFCHRHGGPSLAPVGHKTLQDAVDCWNKQNPKDWEYSVTPFVVAPKAVESAPVSVSYTVIIYPQEKYINVVVNGDVKTFLYSEPFSSLSELA
jgi:hypothetical protein